jgi:hypothetical protein
MAGDDPKAPAAPGILLVDGLVPAQVAPDRMRAACRVVERVEEVDLIEVDRLVVEWWREVDPVQLPKVAVPAAESSSIATARSAIVGAS